jgi:hypothetical protein
MSLSSATVGTTMAVVTTIAIVALLLYLDKIDLFILTTDLSLLLIILVF